MQASSAISRDKVKYSACYLDIVILVSLNGFEALAESVFKCVNIFNIV